MKKTILALFLITSFAACKKDDTLNGNGAIITDERSLVAFTDIIINGTGYVEIVPDTAYFAIVTGYQNLVLAYNTYVSGKRLMLEFDSRYKTIKNNNIFIEVHTPHAEAATINGAGNIVVNPGFIENSFESTINGSGSIEVKLNSFGEMHSSINGSGNIDSRDCHSTKGYAEISGSGNIDIYASQYLFARISGSGNISYYGNPGNTDISVSGSGNVVKK